MQSENANDLRAADMNINRNYLLSNGRQMISHWYFNATQSIALKLKHQLMIHKTKEPNNDLYNTNSLNIIHNSQARTTAKERSFNKARVTRTKQT